MSRITSETFINKEKNYVKKANYMQTRATIKRYQNTMTGDRKILGLFSKLRIIQVTAIRSLLTNKHQH